MKRGAWALVALQLMASTLVQAEVQEPASGGGDWLLAVTASYSAVLLGAAAGVLGAWQPALGLGRWVLIYGLGMGTLALLWQPGDPVMAVVVLAFSCILTAGAFGVLRWLARRLRR
jgi:hypothetical protein